MYVVVGKLPTRTRRVVWALSEMGLPFEHRDAAPRSPEALAVNPSGKVPVLLDGADVVSDSTAILHYLADKEGRLTYPAGTADRARQDAVTFAVLDEIDAPLWQLAKHKFVLPEEYRVPAVRPAAEYEVAQGTARLGALLSDGRPFLAGDRLTVADIVAGHCGTWARSARVPVDPAFDAWVTGLLTRPAAQAAYADV